MKTDSLKRLNAYFNWGNNCRVMKLDYDTALTILWGIKEEAPRTMTEDCHFWHGFWDGKGDKIVVPAIDETI